MTVIVSIGLVLVPGFEPGSTDRESDMMDRTTPHERYLGEAPSLFQNVVFHPSFQITLSLSLTSPLARLICQRPDIGP